MFPELSTNNMAGGPKMNDTSQHSSTVEQRHCRSKVAGSSPAAGSKLKYYKGKPIELDWRDTLQAGDVVYSRGDTNLPRVVRMARYEGPYLRSVSFTIKHCSWTGRCYTILSRSDLKQQAFIKAGVRVRFTTDLDKKINNTIISRERSLKCCDVRGIL